MKPPQRIAVRPEQQLDAYLVALERGDANAAQRIARRLVDGGADPVRVICELLGPAQHEVGVRWARGEWDEAMERTATSITDEVLTLMVATLGPQFATAHSRGAPQVGRVVVSTPRGEWHMLPARMVAETFKMSGWRVSAVPSLTASATADFAQRWGASFVALSCTLTSNLPAAWLTIGALHDVGIPVLVGGRAFGSTANRAKALGGDGFAADGVSAQRLAAAWSTHPPRLRQDAMNDERHGEVLALIRDTGRLASDALDLLAGWTPGLTEGDEFHDALADLNRLLGTITAAVLVDDVSLITEHLDWWAGLLDAQGHPLADPRHWLDAVSRVLPASSTNARALLAAEAQDAQPHPSV